jgi:crotonobetainyl-CoA:carnitine CoA-transferase CaiB-like acyl-CoA transferase
MKAKTRAHWLEGLEKLGVPCGPVNNIDQVFADPQVLARGMKIEMEHTGAGVHLPMIGSPIKMSATPPSYRRAPPACGEHTDEVLAELLGLSASEIAGLRDRGIV